LSLTEADRLGKRRHVNLLALVDALERLDTLNTQKSRIVELRFFGGLTIEERAEALKVLPATVTHDQSTARAWLRSQISNE
jgi:DNA-directed RNA polymerase specialized sigma24 family protein